MHKPARTLPPVAFGAAYYAEYQLEDRIDTDLDLMLEAGFTVIRVGESVWSTWEPRDGEFDLQWLAPVLDGAHARGIRVILGTPTYAIPPWLQRKHPELAVQRADGSSMPWGSRQEVDYSQPLFRRYAERVIRAMLGRYADHPAVVGFQVDNEPGLHQFHNPGAFEGFRDRLRATYGDVETLNREWGLVYWSHRLSSWDDLWRPAGNAQPQYDLAWRRYQAELTTEYLAWQADLVGEYRSPEQFVTTCIAYPRHSIDDREVGAVLDIVAANPYYGSQHHLVLGEYYAPPAAGWTTSGVAGLIRQADRAYSSQQGPFLVTETNASSIGLSDLNQAGYPGQLKLAAFTLIARGAAMVEYWHWHSIHFGTETYWGGILPHSQVPGRFHAEAAQIGALIRSAGDALEGLKPDADVAMLHSNDSRWALIGAPFLRTATGGSDRDSYETVLDAFHLGFVEAGRQVRIVHAEQVGDDPAVFAERHPVLVVPVLYVATDVQLRFLRAYAAAGGHLVIGPRTGYADEEARARRAVAPPVLSEPAGVRYEEFSNLDAPIAVRATALELEAGSAATLWSEGYLVDGADVLVGYDHPEFGRFAAVTTRAVERGRITAVGTVPNPALARSLARWTAPQAVGDAWMHSSAVTVHTATGAAHRVAVVGNWSSAPGAVTPPRDLVDLSTGESVRGGQQLPLEPWATLVLAETDRPVAPAAG